MTQIHTCLNCSAEIRTGPYCERCGQRNVHVRLEFGDLLDDIRTQLLEWDLPWLYTIREALLRPGKVCRDYVNGKRTKYVNPLKYVIYLIPIVLIVLGALPPRYGVYPDISLIDRQTAQAEQLPFAAAYLTGNPIVLLMLLTPAVAVVLRLLYTRDRHNNTEIVCWLLYSIGNGILLAVLVHLGFEFYVYHVRNVIQASSTYLFEYLPVKILFIIVAIALHTVYSASGFFREAWYLTWLKILTTSLVYFGGFSLAFWSLQQTGADTPRVRGSAAVKTESALIDGLPWIELEQSLLARQEESFVNEEYGRFLRVTGRSNDALYSLLLADSELASAPDSRSVFDITADPSYSARVALELAVAYLNLGRQEFALTQLYRYDTPKLRLLRLEAGMQRGAAEELPDLIREAGILVDYNLQLAEWWSAGEIETALDEIRRNTGSAGTAQNQLWMNARWAAVLGDPELAWAIFLDQEQPTELWQSMWMPHFSEVRRLPAFKDYVRTEGLENYWRSTGNWPDLCRPLGDSDFECF